MRDRPYFRPLVETGKMPPEGMPLAGGPLWFCRAERLIRGQPAAIIAAKDIPDAWRARLSSKRAPVAGLTLGRPRLMGILNVTPDSFSDGGRYDTTENALAEARAMARAGADILDIGGESTRPGAEYVPNATEISRTRPVIAALHKGGFELPISIDTRKADVAGAAFLAGAGMLNDVSALTFDPAMTGLIAPLAAPVCLMHAKGPPETMQQDPRYEDVLLDVYDALEARVLGAEAAGIARARIIIDPGIGFGKTKAHNLALIRGLSLFHGLGCAILLGVSRKGFIGAIGQEPVAENRAPGSIALALEGVRQGVQILRVHDIRETRQAVLLWQAVNFQ